MSLGLCNIMTLMLAVYRAPWKIGYSKHDMLERKGIILLYFGLPEGNLLWLLNFNTSDAGP